MALFFSKRTRVAAQLSPTRFSTSPFDQLRRHVDSGLIVGVIIGQT
jgi:hypothetical protein